MSSCFNLPLKSGIPWSTNGPLKINSFISRVSPTVVDPFRVAVLFAQRLLVDLADVCLCEAIDKLDLLGDPVFRNHAAIRELLEMGFHRFVGEAISAALDHQCQRPLA